MKCLIWASQRGIHVTAKGVQRCGLPAMDFTGLTAHLEVTSPMEGLSDLGKIWLWCQMGDNVRKDRLCPWASTGVWVRDNYMGLFLP